MADKLGLLNSIATAAEQAAQKVGKGLVVDPSLVKLPDPKQKPPMVDPNAGVNDEDRAMLKAKRMKAMQATQGLDPDTGLPLQPPAPPVPPAFAPGPAFGEQLVKRGRRR